MTRMAVIYKSSLGAFMDHHIATYQSAVPEENKFSSRSKVQQKNLQQEIQYRWKKELFLVNSPFMMDSQVQRIQRESTAQPGEATVAQRKRKKKEKNKLPLSDQEMKISENISAALPVLIGEARRVHCLQNVETALELTSNNKKSRDSAQIQGCGDLFQNLCSENNTSSYDQAVCGAGNHLLIDNTTLHSAASIIDRVIHNPGDQYITVEMNGHKFLLPGRTSFLTSDFHHFVTQGFQEIKVENGYNLIVIDPPWHNKSVKRKKSYQMVEESDLKQIPISQLTGKDCLVCLWITNNKRLMHFVRDELFPHWSLEWMADWIWMKVTTCGQPVCDILSPHKKPYEQLIIGRYRCSDKDKNVTADVSEQCMTSNTDEETGQQSDTSRNSKTDIPPKYTLVSVPCALHSKKPPLKDVLSSYLTSEPNCLELFARNLLPDWTSWGNEPLRHQHIDYFEQVRDHG